MQATWGHLDLVERVAARGERVVASRFGGHVLSWQDACGRELLYLSPRSAALGGQPLRGGVPVCFPQFSSRGPLPKHGFARTSWWRVVDAGALDSRVRLRLTDNEQTRSIWPHRFVLDLTVSVVPRELEVRLEVRNTDTAVWSFTGALHTYFRVHDVGATKLEGLQGLWREDALAGTFSYAEEPFPRLGSAIDSVYHEVSRPLLLEAGSHPIEITQGGFSDVVVWNPGQENASRFEDISPADIRHLLCVEAAQAAKSIQLEPGRTWTGWQRLRVVPRTAGPSLSQPQTVCTSSR